MVWGTITISLMETKAPVWSTFSGCWAFGAVFELTILGLLATSSAPQDLAVGNLLGSTRAMILVALFLSILFLGYESREKGIRLDEESRSLLASGNIESDGSPSYGSLPSSVHERDSDKDDDSDDEDEEMKELQQKRLEEEGGWWGYLKGFMIFLPLIWPYNNRRMQFWLGILLLAIVVERFLTVLIPRQLGIITDALSNADENRYFPWKELLVWAALKIVSVSAGFDLLRTMANTRIAAYSYRQLSSAAFNHVMGLSMDYHSAKSCGEVLKAIEQGADMHNVIETVVFDAGPMLIDLMVAAVYLSSVFDAYMALIIIATSSAYIYAGIRGNSFLATKRREYSEGERKGNEILYDSVSNWQTVTYHNRRRFEQDRYLDAVDGYKAKEVRYFDVMNCVDSAQSLIMALGLLTSAFLAAARIAAGQAPVGHLVLLITYWASIQEPLGHLTWTLRTTASQLIGAERLLQLLQTKPSVVEKPGAPPLRANAPGRVVFADAAFAYDPRKPTLRDVTFAAEPGQTVALVGETGGGKSTILKLLLRFYDVTAGAITIDGQDVRDVSLDSLRGALGVVPQDPALFNQSIMENVRYARLDATDEEVREACRAAVVHDKIESFPDGYAARVGERGVKLSGGELQRLAIARVFLTDPRIVLLDEATSAIDSGTEARIQEAFRRLSAGRTTFVIAHRLSTIMHADLILVVDNGRIVERGSHAELLKKGGKYQELWSKQSPDGKL
ncbi:Heavy metal tolerance protein [Lasiodiplodia hormozganensis]|uniref:Heavy metal tolerance protein n=1 Tax=Lasiodiplodia hormozganensis TaxID=869390 RepID=A0AA39YZF6_9PEZI|nr:Heavy metal tolerance protein [Lasiodiplodia hormozganensis]